MVFASSVGKIDTKALERPRPQQDKEKCPDSRLLDPGVHGNVHAPAASRPGSAWREKGREAEPQALCRPRQSLGLRRSRFTYLRLPFFILPRLRVPLLTLVLVLQDAR